MSEKLSPGYLHEKSRLQKMVENSRNYVNRNNINVKLQISICIWIFTCTKSTFLFLKDACMALEHAISGFFLYFLDFLISVIVHVRNQPIVIFGKKYEDLALGIFL